MSTSPTGTLFSQSDAFEPLAARMRPSRLEDFLGQEHLVGPGRPLRDLVERGDVGSMILWGPPGSGKTSLARLIANYTDRCFEPFSAVTEGVPRVRAIIAEAKRRRQEEGRGTILFCDEIHRFNKAQQDAFLPWVEDGTVTLIGATTENPSFELNSALLSRVPVHVLEPLAPVHLRALVDRALLALPVPPGVGVRLADAAMSALLRHADGDARRALNALEAMLESLPEPSRDGDGMPAVVEISADALEAVLSRRLPRYDKAGEEHYNLISALHKSVRGSDVEGALYWLARMVEGGEDPMFLARRVVRMAVEDIGLADPRALSIALAAKETYHFLGSPEGELALAEAVVYLATCPKSNRVYQAWTRAVTAARDHPAAPVPMHIRNAPTKLMQQLGYGRGYRYDHGEEHGYAVGQEYLPDVLRGETWYEPTNLGGEKTIRERMAWWQEMKERVAKAR